MEMSSERRWCISVAVVKPMGTSLDAVGWKGYQWDGSTGEKGGVNLLLRSWWLFVRRFL